MNIAHDTRKPTTREQRALDLYERRGHGIRKVGEDLYRVPSCTGRGEYVVDYACETCDCPDFTYRQENCKHILAVGVYLAKRRNHEAKPDEHPHACLGGYVYLGYTVLDEETGEEVERTEALPCRRCAENA